MDSGFPTKTRAIFFYGATLPNPKRSRRFWILGGVTGLLLYHSYGILSGIYSSMSIVSYQDALIIGGFEILASLVLIPIFLAKFFVYWHDRPKRLKHVFDDPGLLD